MIPDLAAKEPFATRFADALRAHHQGDPSARVQFGELANACTTQLGPDHHHTLVARHRYALSVMHDKPARAVVILSDVGKRREACFGPTYRETLAAHRHHAIALHIRGILSQTPADSADAQILLEQTLARQRATQPPDHPDRIDGERTLARLIAFRRKRQREIENYQTALLGIGGLIIGLIGISAASPTTIVIGVGAIIAARVIWFRRRHRDRHAARLLAQPPTPDAVPPTSNGT